MYIKCISFTEITCFVFNEIYTQLITDRKICIKEKFVITFW